MDSLFYLTISIPFNYHMKHFYSLVFALVTLLFPFASSAQEITIKVDVPNADAVTITLANQPVPVVTGINEYAAKAYDQLLIEPTEGYLLTKVIEFGGWETRVTGSYSTYLSESYNGGTLKLFTYLEEEYYDSTFELYLDNPDRIAVRFSGTYRLVSNVETGWNTVKYSSMDEIAVDVTAAYYGDALYQVLKDGESVPFSYGTASITLSQDLKIEVFANFPEIKVPVHFTIVNPGTEGYISKMTLDGETISPEVYLADDFEVQLGSKIVLTANSNDYKLNSFTVNGQTEYFYYTYNTVVTGETNFVLDAKAYTQSTKIINITNADLVTLYRGQSYNNDTLFVHEGVNEYPYSTGSPVIAVVAKTGAYIATLTDGDKDLLEDYNTYNTSFSLEDEGELTIVAEKLTLDKKVVVYIDDLSKANTYFSFYNYNREQFAVNSGYNIIEYYDGYVPFAMAWYGAPFNNLYLNGEKQEGMYGSDTNYQLDPTDGDVYKVFFTCDPEPLALTFECDAETAVTATTDILTPVADLNSTMNVLPSTLVKISAEPGKKVAVTVGNAPAEDVEELEFVVEADVTVKISDISTTAVENVAVSEFENTDVYNLQGIRVADKADFDALPAGIYIVNGTKIVKE